MVLPPVRSISKATNKNIHIRNPPILHTTQAAARVATKSLATRLLCLHTVCHHHNQTLEILHLVNSACGINLNPIHNLVKLKVYLQ